MSAQYFNFGAIQTTVHTLFKTPRHFIPQLKIKDVGELRYSELKDKGFRAIIFDKDNTLTAPYKHEYFHNRLQGYLSDCKAEFGSSNVAICSNTAGSRHDRVRNNYSQAAELEVVLGLKVIKHEFNKPNVSFKDILSHFESLRSLDSEPPLQPHQVIVVGDRIVGDVMWANNLGMFSVKTEPLTLDGENWAVKLARKFEDAAEKLLSFSGMSPPSHPLVPNFAQFQYDVTYPKEGDISTKI